MLRRLLWRINLDRPPLPRRWRRGRRVSFHDHGEQRLGHVTDIIVLPYGPGVFICVTTPDGNYPLAVGQDEYVIITE